jgi:hypothetical protein
MQLDTDTGYEKSTRQAWIVEIPPSREKASQKTE